MTKRPDPTDEEFRNLARSNIDFLITWMDELLPSDLTYAAEILGTRCLPGNRSKAIKKLLTLLDHEDASVREGTLLGLKPHLNDVVTARMLIVAKKDPNQNVRTVAQGLLKNG